MKPENRRAIIGSCWNNPAKGCCWSSASIRALRTKHIPTDGAQSRGIRRGRRLRRIRNAEPFVGTCDGQTELVGNVGRRDVPEKSGCRGRSAATLSGSGHIGRFRKRYFDKTLFETVFSGFIQRAACESGAMVSNRETYGERKSPPFALCPIRPGIGAVRGGKIYDKLK